MNRLCRLKPYVTTTEPPKVTTQRTTITTTPAHRLETGMGGGLGVAGRKNNTKKNELDQVGNVTQTTGQLPRHPTTEMPENCGKTNGQTLICSPDVNEENNDATVTLNSIHVSDRSSATSVLASFFLLPSSLAVLGLLRGARFTFLHST